MSRERTGAIDEIDRLCTEIRQAVETNDYDKATRLLARRHQSLELMFAAPDKSPAWLEQLKAVAERVMAFDCELMPIADAARGQAAENLRKLRLGREASHVYRQFTG